MIRPTPEELEQRLRERFPEAVEIEVIDDSAAHAGHAGALSGAGHYRVRIVSTRFADRVPVARHRLVYDAVHDWIPVRIHALSIDAQTPAA